MKDKRKPCEPGRKEKYVCHIIILLIVTMKQQLTMTPIYPSRIVVVRNSVYCIDTHETHTHTKESFEWVVIFMTDGR